MTTLEDAQADMRRRQQTLRDGKPQFNQSNGGTGGEELLCPYCRSVAATRDRITTEVAPCRACRRIRARIAKYGMNLFQYFKILKQQDNQCAICLVPFGGRAYACVDHCHDREHVRGLLCPSCNWGLGHFKDSEEVLLRAAKYAKFNEVDRRWWANKLTVVAV